jgi:hypothetical protein
MKSLFKYILASLLFLSVNNVSGAECDIPMCVIIDKGFANITPEAASVLETQLQRLATQSGLDIGWKNSRFILTAKMEQMDRYIVDGAPVQIVNVFGVTVYIADIYNQKLFNSTYIEVKGIKDNKSKRKLEWFPYPIKVYGAKEMKPYLKYMEETYGKNWKEKF